MRKHIYIILPIALLIIIAIVFTYLIFFHDNTGKVDMLSVSSNGRYVISTDEQETAILWDIKKRTHKVVARKVHIYSAYFIPHTLQYLYQTQDKVIHIRNVDGQDIEDFKVPFLIYGVVMSSDKKYFLAGDIRWGLSLCIDKKCRRILGNSKRDQTEITALKPYNLSMTPDQRYAVGSRLGTLGSTSPHLNDKNYLLELGTQGVVLWDMHTGKPIREYPGNQSQTFATLSPDGQYVVAGDVGSSGFVWQRNTGKRLFRLYDLTSGRMIKTILCEKNVNCKWDKSVLKVNPPKNFTQIDGFQSSAVFAVKFIDATHYLRFTTHIPYAILYKVTDPSPLKYFYLGKHPMPSVNYYQFDGAVDTSSSAHILVMGKAGDENVGGILVYRYDPKKQTLTQIWNA